MERDALLWQEYCMRPGALSADGKHPAIAQLPAASAVPDVHSLQAVGGGLLPERPFSLPFPKKQHLCDSAAPVYVHMDVVSKHPVPLHMDTSHRASTGLCHHVPHRRSL